jgi:hypothetical protein
VTDRTSDSDSRSFDEEWERRVHAESVEAGTNDPATIAAASRARSSIEEPTRSRPQPRLTSYFFTILLASGFLLFLVSDHFVIFDSQNYVGLAVGLGLMIAAVCNAMAK